MIFYDDTKELRTIHQDIHLSGGLPRSIPWSRFAYPAFPWSPHLHDSIFYDDTKELRTIHQDIHLSGGLPRSIPRSRQN